MDTEWEDQHHVEGQICVLLKDYQGIPVDLTSFTLTADVEEARAYLAYVIDVHSRMLYKNPIVSDLGQFFAWLRVHGREAARQKVYDWVLEQNEYKFQYECLSRLIAWAEGLSPLPRADGTKLRVRLYGPYGTSGYARAFRDVVSCLVTATDLDFTYVPLTVQEFNPRDANPENILLSRLLARRDVEGLHECSFADKADVVLIHSVPDMWQPIVRRERLLNPAVRTVGMTVWETDHFPFDWLPHFRVVDRVTFPNRWNVAAALSDVPGVDATFLPHPVIRPVPYTPKDTMPDALRELLDLKAKDPSLYVFYTINEFSGRKGLHLLLRNYIEEFRRDDKVVLFIKTHGSVKEDIARELIRRFTGSMADPPRIVMDYSRWEDDDIHRLHDESHCFVTLTRSEGHGLGACMAALLGKRVVMTQYGGQTDYLRDIDYVPYTLTPASFCSLFDARHETCLDMPSCKHFRFFLPSQQKWALPDDTATKTILRQAYEGRLTGRHETVSFLEGICGPATVASNFHAYIRDTAASTASLVTVPPLLQEDTYCRPRKFFCEQRHVLAASDLGLADMRIRSRRPRVTVIGCFFYGNMGDDLYAALHETMLSGDFDLRLCNTTTYYSRTTGKLRYVKDFVPGDVEPTDYVLIGGGGMLNDAEINSSIFKVYFPYCQANGVPLSIISVGFGFEPDSGKTQQVSAAVRQAYTPLLRYANLISVRSMADRDAAKSMLPPERHFRLHVLPDLVFGVDRVFPAGRMGLTLPDRYVVFCPTTYLSVSVPDVAMLLQKKLWEHPGSKLVVLPLEGVDNVEVYPTRFVTQESARIRALFPDAIFFQGRFPTGGFLELTGATTPKESTRQSLGLCVEVLRRSSSIVTGRYHGLVLAKLFGIDVDTGNAEIVKVRQELISPLDIGRWQEHYDALKADVLASVYVPVDKAREILTDPDAWEEDTRNSCITDLVTQTPSPCWAQSVPFVQGLSNRDLWLRKRSLLLNRHRT